jgi:hypothetical protein
VNAGRQAIVEAIAAGDKEIQGEGAIDGRRIWGIN